MKHNSVNGVAMCSLLHYLISDSERQACRIEIIVMYNSKIGQFYGCETLKTFLTLFLAVIELGTGRNSWNVRTLHHQWGQNVVNMTDAANIGEVGASIARWNFGG